MSTRTEARDAVLGAVRAAWLANGTTAPIAMHWDDVASDPTGHDAQGLPLPWARASVRFLASPVEAHGNNEAKHLTEGILTVQLFAPFGDGHKLGDELAEVLEVAFRARRIGDLWFYGARSPEVGREGPWFRTDFVANFRFEERVVLVGF